MTSQPFLSASYHYKVNFRKMSLFAQMQPGFGKAFSILGLIFVPISSYLRRTYSSTLDITQMCYIFAFRFAANQDLFSDYLDYSWISFMPSFIHFCEPHEFACKHGNLVSPLIVWTATVVLVLLVVKLIQIKKKNIHFQPFYSFFKGFMRWFMGPLLYLSVQVFIDSFQTTRLIETFVPAVVMIAYFGIVAGLEVVGYTRSQKPKQNTFKKWVEFFNHARMGLVMIFLNLVNKNHPDVKYGVILVFVIYDLFFFAKYIFGYQPIEQVLFVVSEVLLFLLFVLFLFWPQHIAYYNLDFYFILVTIAIQMCNLLFRFNFRLSLGNEDLGLVEHQREMDRKKEKALERKKEELQKKNSPPESHKGDSKPRGKRKDKKTQKSVKAESANDMLEDVVVIRKRIF